MREGKSYQGIRSRLESYKTEESKRFYQQEKDVGHLHGNYVEDVYLLLLELDRLEEKIGKMEDAYQ